MVWILVFHFSRVMAGLPLAAPPLLGLVLGQEVPSQKCYCPMMALRAAHIPSAASAVFQIALEGEVFSKELLCRVTNFHFHGCERRWGFTPELELNRGIPLKRNWLLRKCSSQLTFSSIHSSLTVFKVDYVKFQADVDYFGQQKCGTSSCTGLLSTMTAPMIWG